LTTTLGLHGHTHVPIVFAALAEGLVVASPGDGDGLDLTTDRMLLNPGSVGQPRDGDPRASYLILDLGLRQVVWRRVGYEIGPVQDAIRAAGLPGRLADRLAVGH
jgi:diadenosine tetraphosphatase ApaH/serine/threonine PP2A family protein phosphatase